MLNRLQEWLEGIRSPDMEVVVTFVLKFQDLELGQLKVEKGEWEFRYSEEFKAQSELKTLTDFPDVDRIYKDAELWPFFSQRIPSLHQHSVQEFMRRKEIKEVDEATLLERFGRRTIANPYELVPQPA